MQETTQSESQWEECGKNVLNDLGDALRYLGDASYAILPKDVAHNLGDLRALLDDGGPPALRPPSRLVSPFQQMQQQGGVAGAQLAGAGLARVLQLLGDVLPVDRHGGVDALARDPAQRRRLVEAPGVVVGVVEGRDHGC